MDVDGAAFRWSRRLVGVIGVGLGLVGTSGVLDLMRELTGEAQQEKKTQQAVAFDVPQAARPPAPRATPRAEARASNNNRAKAAPRPAAALASGLGGLDFGLPSLDGAMQDATAAVVGERRDQVMTEDAVDTPPRPVDRVAPEFPARARARDTSGFVTCSLLIAPDGQVRDVRVLESQPPGVFDEAAVTALRQWTFQPGEYEGQPVSVRVRQTLRFELE